MVIPKRVNVPPIITLLSESTCIVLTAQLITTSYDEILNHVEDNIANPVCLTPHIVTNAPPTYMLSSVRNPIFCTVVLIFGLNVGLVTPTANSDAPHV